MKTSLNLNRITQRLLLALSTCALCQLAQAVVPPPDGGYPGFNTAEGQNALKSLTTGVGNAAVGWYSLFSNTAGSYNTAIGAGTLLANTADQNTATGVGALLSNTNGSQNTASGAFALFSNTEGLLNTATGANALFSNTTGDDNVAFGYQALYHNTTGGINTAVGWQALFSNTEGSSNTANGVNVLYSNTTGSQNTASGDGALFYNTIGGQNTATGYAALNNNTEGVGNSAVGSGSLLSNISGEYNAALGFQALTNNTTGTHNTAIGTVSLFQNTTGEFNTAVGNGALYHSTGTSNVAIGDLAGDNVMTASNVICLGGSVVGADVSNSCYIGNIWAQNGGPQAVYVSSSGKLGAQVSSRRFKDEIKPMERVSEVIYALKPVSFRYKAEIEPTRPVGFGLIAEEVEKISPDLVMHSGDGQVSSVRYDSINAMLLNEFLKEHKKVDEQQGKLAKQDEIIAGLKSMAAEQETRFAQQQAQIQALTVGLQKVSAQLKVATPVQGVAANGR